MSAFRSGKQNLRVAELKEYEEKLSTLRLITLSDLIELFSMYKCGWDNVQRLRQLVPQRGIADT